MKGSTRTVLVMRHGHAAGGGAQAGDMARRLTPMGVEAVRAKADAVRAFAPDLVLCSPAQRTRMTTEALDLDGSEVRFEPAVYGGGPEEVVEELTVLEEEIRTVLVVGHLPTLELVVHLLTGQEAPGFSPSSLAVLTGGGSWSSFGFGTCQLESFLR